MEDDFVHYLKSIEDELRLAKLRSRGELGILKTILVDEEVEVSSFTDTYDSKLKLGRKK